MHEENELENARRIHAELDQKFRDLDRRIRAKVPRTLFRFFVFGCTVGVMFGFMLGRLLAEGR